VELHVDLFVDQSLGVGVEVGADLGHRHFDVCLSEGNWEVDQKEIDVIGVCFVFGNLSSTRLHTGNAE